MFTGVDIFVVVAIALLSAILGLVVALVLWYLVVLTYDEIKEFVDVYKGERRKCLDDDDLLYSKWVEDFHKEPFSKMREYADAH
jgi:hypothetical protein